MIDDDSGSNIEWTAADGARSDVFELHGKTDGFVCGIAIKSSREGHDPILEVKLPETKIVLIQVRHERGRIVDPTLIRLPEWMQRDIENGRAKISHEEDRVWLIHYHVSELVSRHDFSECVESLVHSLLGIGISPGRYSCDICPRQATATSYRDGRLVQMCDLCATHGNRPSPFQDKPSARPGIQLIALSSEIVRSALLWAVLTLAFQLGGRLLTTVTGMKRVYLPAMLEGLVLLVIGWFVGAPIGKRIQTWAYPLRRARMISGMACLVSILAGELTYVSFDWRIATGAWSQFNLLDSLFQRWWNEGIHTFIRAVAAGAAIFAACATIEPSPATVCRKA